MATETTAVRLGYGYDHSSTYAPTTNIAASDTLFNAAARACCIAITDANKISDNAFLLITKLTSATGTLTIAASDTGINAKKIDITLSNVSTIIAYPLKGLRSQILQSDGSIKMISTALCSVAVVDPVRLPA